MVAASGQHVLVIYREWNSQQTDMAMHFVNFWKLNEQIITLEIWILLIVLTSMNIFLNVLNRTDNCYIIMKANVTYNKWGLLDGKHVHLLIHTHTRHVRAISITYKYGAAFDLP